jgi:hypothetical protein
MKNLAIECRFGSSGFEQAGVSLVDQPAASIVRLAIITHIG